MSPTDKSGMSKASHPISDVSSMRASLTEVTDSLDGNTGAVMTDSPDKVPPTRHGSPWHRSAGIGLLVLGIIGGALLALHTVNDNKKAALNANQSDQGLAIKSQSIGLSGLGLKSIGLLAQEQGTLTVNGDIDVAGSVILNPSPTPTGGLVAGQLYYSQQKNQLGYYNGSGFQYLQGGTTGNTTTNNNVSNIKNVYNVSNVSNVTNISNFTNAVTGPDGVIPMFDGSGLTDSQINENGNGVAVGTTANTTTRFEVSGATDDSSTSALTITNSDGDTIGQFSDDGLVNLGIGPGATLGNDVIEPSYDGGINGIVTADKFTTTNAVTVTALNVYNGSVGVYPYNQFQFAIYKDNGGTPGAWIASSTIGILNANSWNSLPISASLAAGTSYWFAYTTSSNNANQDDPYFQLTASPTHAYANFNFDTGTEAGMPAVFPGGATVNDFTHSIYANTLGTNSEITIAQGGNFTDTGPAVFEDTNDSANAFQVQNNGGFDVLDVDTTDANVGIGTSNPTTARLTVFGASSDNTTNALSVSDSSGNTLAQVGDDGSVKLGESYGVFGNNSAGNYIGAGYYSAPNELLQAQSFTTTTGGAIQSLSTYIGAGVSPNYDLYQMAVYSNAGGVPKNLIASTVVGTLTGSGWNTLPITATLAPNTTYWLVYWTNVEDGNNNGQDFIQGYNGPNRFYQAHAVWQSGDSNGMYSVFPSGSGPSTSYETSIYATYTTPSSALSIDSTGNVTSSGTLTIQNSSSAALDVSDSTGGTAFYVDAGSHFVGVNTNNTDGFNFVVNGTSAFGGIYNSQAFRIMNASGLALMNGDTNSQILTVGDATSGTTFATLALENAHFSSAQTTAPTFVAPLNCGTSPGAAVTAGSTDSAGSFTVQTGSSGPTTCDTTISFNKAYTSIPKSVILTPALGIDGATVSTAATVSAVTANGFTVEITSPAASTNYSYYYWVVQ